MLLLFPLTTHPQVPDVEQFMATYNMQCPMAAHRLKKGIPATLDYGVRPNPEQTSSAIAVAETVQVRAAVALGGCGPGCLRCCWALADLSAGNVATAACPPHARLLLEPLVRRPVAVLTVLPSLVPSAPPCRSTSSRPWTR